MERAVDAFQRFLVGSVDGDVELSYRNEGGELRGVLSIADEEG